MTAKQEHALSLLMDVLRHTIGAILVYLLVLLGDYALHGQLDIFGAVPAAIGYIIAVALIKIVDIYKHRTSSNP